MLKPTTQMITALVIAAVLSCPAMAQRADIREARERAEQVKADARALIAERGTGCRGFLNPVFPAAAGKDYAGTCWKVSDDTDAMTDRRHCLIAPAGRHDTARPSVVLMRDGASITVSGDDEQYPGSDIAIRVDSNPAITGAESLTGQAALGALRDMRHGESVLVRYVRWPSNAYLDGRYDLAGFGEALDACINLLGQDAPELSNPPQ